MSSIREPLDKLLHKGVKYEWSTKCQEAFNKFKSILSSPLLLTHFNPDLKISIAADASEFGIGCVIYHNYPDGSIKAYYHASRRLTLAERKYAQIEKEALALVFAVEKFRKYLFGREFTLYSDHQPLIYIFGSKTGIPAHTANRLQRWAVKLLDYSFIIKHTETSQFGHADVLLRLIAQRTNEKEDNIVIAKVDRQICTTFIDEMNKNLPVRFRDIQHETQKDDQMRTVMLFLINGWPPSLEFKYDKVLSKCRW